MYDADIPGFRNWVKGDSDICVIDGRRRCSGSGPGPIADAPSRASLISQGWYT